MKILIVDDEVDFAETLAERLEIRGHDLVIAHTGKEALEKVVQWVPNIILLDINMPDINGFEVLVKLVEGSPSIPVYMLTGHAYESHKDEALEKGARDCLTKPIDIKILLEKLAELEG